MTIAAGWSLWTRTGEAFSWPGLIVALATIPSMRYLAHRKIAVAEKLGSRALRADAMEAVTCGWLSFVVVISLGAQWAIGAWWIDGVASLAIVWLLVKEGREAWAGRECCERAVDPRRAAWREDLRPRPPTCPRHGGDHRYYVESPIALCQGDWPSFGLRLQWAPERRQDLFQDL